VAFAGVEDGVVLRAASGEEGLDVWDGVPGERDVVALVVEVAAFFADFEMRKALG
jgi:hypothetical protein